MASHGFPDRHSIEVLADLADMAASICGLDSDQLDRFLAAMQHNGFVVVAAVNAYQDGAFQATPLPRHDVKDFNNMLDASPGWDVTARLNSSDRHTYVYEVLHACAVLNQAEDQARSAGPSRVPSFAAPSEQYPVALIAKEDASMDSSSIYAFHGRVTGIHTPLSKRLKFVERAHGSCSTNGHLHGVPAILEAAYVTGLSTKRKHELSSGMHIAFREELAPTIVAMKGMRDKLLDFFTGVTACLLVDVDEGMYPPADASYGWMFVPGEEEMRRFLATPGELHQLYQKFNTLPTEDPRVRSRRKLCHAVGPY
jgi:hypothetical protein